MKIEAISARRILPAGSDCTTTWISAPTAAAVTTRMAVLMIPAALRSSREWSSRLNLRSSLSIKAAISDTGCPRRRQSQPGSPISASNATAAITMNNPLAEINILAVHAFELGSELFQCFRQHRSAADGEPFRNHDAFRRRIKSLERRMQQEGAAFIFGDTTVFRNQDEIRLQADDGFERSKSAGFDAEIAGRVDEAGIGQ